MAIPPQFGIVTLGVDDLDRAIGFYAALGWERCSSSNEEICWFKTAGSYIGLFPYASLAEDAKLPANPRPKFGGITLAVNVNDEQKVDAALAAAQRAGATIIKPAERMDWGGYSGYFTDLDGYPWEVAFNPAFPLDDEGRLTIP